VWTRKHTKLDAMKLLGVCRRKELGSRAESG
jgi:hypothetical protein